MVKMRGSEVGPHSVLSSAAFRPTVYPQDATVRTWRRGRSHRARAAPLSELDCLKENEVPGSPAQLGGTERGGPCEWSWARGRGIKWRRARGRAENGAGGEAGNTKEEGAGPAKRRPAGARAVAGIEERTARVEARRERGWRGGQGHGPGKSSAPPSLRTQSEGASAESGISRAPRRWPPVPAHTSRPTPRPASHTPRVYVY